MWSSESHLSKASIDVGDVHALQNPKIIVPNKFSDVLEFLNLADLVLFAARPGQVTTIFAAGLVSRAGQLVRCANHIFQCSGARGIRKGELPLNSAYIMIIRKSVIIDRSNDIIASVGSNVAPLDGMTIAGQDEWLHAVEGYPE